MKLHGLLIDKRPGPNFMALLTVSKESALTETGKSALTSSIFHGLAENFYGFGFRFSFFGFAIDFLL